MKELTAAIAFLLITACGSNQDSTLQPQESSPLQSQAGSNGQTGFWDSQEPLHLTLEAPFDKTFREANIGDNFNSETSVKVSFPITVKYEDSAGTSFATEASANIRGQRTLKACKFPKLKLKISKDNRARVPLFSDASEIRLGTHCDEKEGNDSYGKVLNQKGAFRESFVHHMMGLLGILGQRSRPLLITYVDTSNGSQLTRQAFAFEDVDLVAKRTDAIALKDTSGYYTDLDGSGVNALDLTQTARAILFEVLAGNWDYNISTSTGRLYTKNMEIIKMADGRLIPIAHDFDLATMVTGHLLQPHPDRSSRSILVVPNREQSEGAMRKNLNNVLNQRIYSASQLKQAANDFVGKENLLLEVLAAFPMDDEGKHNIETQIRAFFSVFPGFLQNLEQN